jgi:SAM-dependent methyltransferase
MENLLAKYLNVYWLRPGLALWRAIEAKTIQKVWSKVNSLSIDLGCGDGVFLWILKGGDFDFATDCYIKKKKIPKRKPKTTFDIGLDIDLKVLKLAKDIKAYKYYVQADMGMLPFKRNVFNTVFCNGVVEHYIKLSSLLQEIKRTIKPTGTFVTTVSTDIFLKYLFFYPLALKMQKLGLYKISRLIAKFDQGRYKSHIHCYSPDKWKQKLEEEGFKVMTYEKYLPPPAVKVWDTGVRLFTPITLRGVVLLEKMKLRIIIKRISILFMRVLLNKYYSKKGKGSFLLLISKVC